MIDLDIFCRFTYHRLARMPTLELIVTAGKTTAFRSLQRKLVGPVDLASRVWMARAYDRQRGTDLVLRLHLVQDL